MKVLVCSDSHGFLSFGEEMLEKEKDCTTIFFLGDGLKDIEQLKSFYKDRNFICVKGNNDLYTDAQDEAYKHIDGVTIMACHGHLFDVRLSMSRLIKKASGVMAHLVLFGHTHHHGIYNDPVTGICAVNPGALCMGRYCVITIEKGQFDIIFKTLL